MGKYNNTSSSGARKPSYLKNKIELKTSNDRIKELMNTEQWKIFIAAPIHHRKFLVKEVFQL